MSDTAALQRSPLHEKHLALGGRLIPFAGWEMPVQYSGIVDEHKAVRERAGVFDISHMGQFIVSGAAALDFLNHALTNDLAELDVGQGQYTLMLNESGGVIDDLIAYRIARNEYFLVVNASKITEDRAHLAALMKQRDPVDELEMRDISAQTAGLAIQGPRSRAVFERVFGVESAFPERNTVLVTLHETGFMWLCGTGYTGEEGFEFFMPAATSHEWFDIILDAVRAEGGLPCGLGARDTLRLEMGYPLNGSDLAPDKTPLEAGLAFFLELEKPDFTGKAALVAQKESGLPCKLAAFKMTGSCPPPRPHYPVVHEGVVVGEVASGTQSPSLGCGIGMAYLPPAAALIGRHIEIEIRGRRFPAEVVKKPFFKKA
ncbi:MAG TPA: glycine cleavage system aminomethyltransferase GcvT [Verrucomicrobiales bacterium]|nr:glycine cleavage system aminomethyltransferase GcvT [Verrucomicrobiales bacterium]HRJ08840.1 glycine cleavage system aminomethyltransferase GcvT [Prosthecobacter sp.]HRK13728.1 glycine cleavage system aminomethyltransferase GcvT [Prosthecobacter sp.]